jgi:biotin/methionine sulfoxide reductase
MPGVVVMAAGAWLDPADAVGEPERHGNPNVLPRHRHVAARTGTNALTALVETDVPGQTWNHYGKTTKAG